MTMASKNLEAPVWATLLATVTGNLFLVVGTLLFAILALLVSWIPPRGDWTYRVARMWSRGVLLTSGVKVHSRFETPLAAGGRYVFMANHRSLFDIPALMVSLPGQTRFLAKKSLFQIPIFGCEPGSRCSSFRRGRDRRWRRFSRSDEGASCWL